MDKSTLAFRLLALFSTKQRALEIEGDLLEESAQRGRGWFVTHVLSVTLALFRESLEEAPCRTAALGAIATGLAFLTCRVATGLFLATNAFYPSPFLGTCIVPLCGFLIGSGLGYVASSLAVRAAALTAIVLSCCLFFTLIGADSSQIPVESASGPILPVVKAIFSIALAFAEGIVLFIAPLMAGSIYSRDLSVAG